MDGRLGVGRCQETMVTGKILTPDRQTEIEKEKVKREGMEEWLSDFWSYCGGTTRRTGN